MDPLHCSEIKPIVSINAIVSIHRSIADCAQLRFQCNFFARIVADDQTRLIIKNKNEFYRYVCIMDMCLAILHCKYVMKKPLR